MQEIELKAHVRDRNLLLQKLNSFARFDRIIIKDDEYFKFAAPHSFAAPKAAAAPEVPGFSNEPHFSHSPRLQQAAGSSEAGHITARIRKETQCSKESLLAAFLQNGTIPESDVSARKIFLTYKKKERRVGESGAVLEVNDERECELSDDFALKSLLLDSGFEPYFTKHKDTIGFYFDTDCGEAHLEVCAVPPLGDFLEIEIVSENPDEAGQKRIQQKLEELLLQCGLTLADIEKKYYSELLAQANANATATATVSHKTNASRQL